MKMTAPRIVKGLPSVFKKETRGVGEYFFDAAGKHGDKICQIEATTGRKESFISVRERSTRAAIHMRRLGVELGDIVLLCCRNNLDGVIPALGALFLGAKVSAVDPTLAARDCAHCLLIVKPRFIFVAEDCVELMENSLLETKFEANLIVMGESSKYKTFSDLQRVSDEEKDFKPTVITDCHDTAFILFSSGTTGLPKGICLTHFGVLNAIIAFVEQGSMNPNVTLGFTYLYWVSAVMLITISFVTGGSRVLPLKFDAENALQLIEKYKVTFMMIPTIYTYYFTSDERFKIYDTSSLEVIVIAGTPISLEQLMRTKQFFKNTFVSIGYGITETTGCVTCFDLNRDRHLVNRVTSSGRTVMDTEVKVVDPETRELLGPNQKGEICIRSPYAMKGYYSIDSSNAFDEEGFIKTGDIGYYDEDDCFYIIDRIKEMFKYRSWHVVPMSLESLLHEHPAVKEAAVFGIPHEVDEFHPAACITLKDNIEVSVEEIDEFVSSQVSEWHKLRGGIKIVDSIVKTASGKIQRRKMRDIFLTS